MGIDKELVNDALSRLKNRLIGSRTESGHWTGRLSSSALSTATALFALAMVDRQKHSSLIRLGLDWLAKNQNSDGGWGDTVTSKSNISTAMLCWAALSVAEDSKRYEETICHVEGWLAECAGSIEPNDLVEAIYENYGTDRTFSVPILTMCALAGRLGADPWQFVMPLPFEFAACPSAMFKWLNLNVVSYALPALIAIGQANYHKNPPKNPVTRFFRRLTRDRTLRILHNIQPENGGFLEAAPLTSFVVMSLVAADQANGDVVARGVNLGGVINGISKFEPAYFFNPLWNDCFSPLSENKGILDWFTIIIGVIAVVTLTIHGAAWIILKTNSSINEKLKKVIFRLSILLIPLIIISVFTWLFVKPNAMENYFEYPVLWFFPLIVVIGITGLLKIYSFKKDSSGFIFSSIFIVGAFGSTVASLFPVLLPSSNSLNPSLTIFNASTSEYGLNVGIIWWTFAIILVLGYFYYVHHVFRGKVDDIEYH